MRDDIDDVMDRFFEYCSRYTSLAIYGAGDVGRMVAEFMDEKRIPFVCFCVTRKPENQMLKNHEIREINEVSCSDGEIGIIVAVSCKNAGGILDALDERGYSYFYSTEFLFQLFKSKCQISLSRVRIENGFIVRVGDVVLRQDTMYVCCPASIGDTLYVAAFVQAYKMERDNLQRVCLIVKKSHREVGILFSAVDETIISDQIVETLNHYSMYTQTWRLGNYMYGHFKKSLRFEYDPEYNREDCRWIIPRYGKLILNITKEASPEGIRLDWHTAYMEKRNFDIVIMPYAKTAVMLQNSFWEELVRRLHEKGYSVYTNVGGEKEKALPGTVAVAESLMNTAQFCEKCAAVISLRSGMCDLLGFMQVKLVVINTSRELADEWNLKDVFEREGIHNIECFGEAEYNKKIDEIMEIVG